MPWAITAGAVSAMVAASTAKAQAAEGRARSRADMSNWIRQPMRTNCVNCGAPIEALCSYCGTQEPLNMVPEGAGADGSWGGP